MTASPERRYFPPIKYAYDPEAQALGVQRAQIERDLFSYAIEFDPSLLSVRPEIGHNWVTYRDRVFFEEHCNIQAWSGLKKGDILIFISSQYASPEIFDGRDLRVGAAVLHGNTILYQSPLFNLDYYVATNPDHGILVTKIKAAETWRILHDDKNGQEKVNWKF